MRAASPIKASRVERMLFATRNAIGGDCRERERRADIQAQAPICALKKCMYIKIYTLLKSDSNGRERD